jgi:type II secretory pathway pseudopilin PulG
MAIAALVVAIVSALAAVGAAVYARRLDGRAKEAVAAAGRSAAASEKRAALEGERRHAELTPRFRVRVAPADAEKVFRSLMVALAGPPELGRVD